MTTITREQAQKIIEAADEVISALAGTNEDVHPGSDNMLRLWDDLNDRYAPPEVVRELARIVLASLEAEPVAKIIAHYPLGIDVGKQKFVQAIGELPDFGGHLFAAPPVPVVPEEKPMPNPLSMYAVDAVAAIAEVRGWNACRAAMLQGSQPVSQTYKFPVNTPCQDAPAHIWLQTAGVWPEDGELSELTWCSHNQHHDDTLYVRADLVNGNSPVTPDSWISCSKRMPEDTKMLLAFSQGEIVAAYWNWVVNPIDYKKYRAFTYLSGNILDDVTHWMPLPEPPQEVNRD
ncbi:TPA: DUF551 domain-containing protein [Escherichia coli]|nr:DUF551 domain-containing protein [Escherichia coli]HDQ4936990.1 DUF551 domain-containing protein [Escherichia coli]HDQ5202017.1 DUF551 domain-containing protein [Escherichia coli]